MRLESQVVPMSAVESAYRAMWHAAAVAWPQRDIRAARELEELTEWREWLNTYCQPILRPILDLHAPDTFTGQWGECQGCDPGAYAEGRADWPCATVEMIYNLTLDDTPTG